MSLTLPNVVCMQIFVLMLSLTLVSSKRLRKPNIKVSPFVENMLKEELIGGFEKQLDKWIEENEDIVNNEQRTVLLFLTRCLPLMNFQSIMRRVDKFIGVKERSVNRFRRVIVHLMTHGHLNLIPYMCKSWYEHGIPKLEPYMYAVINSTIDDLSVDDPNCKRQFKTIQEIVIAKHHLKHHGVTDPTLAGIKFSAHQHNVIPDRSNDKEIIIPRDDDHSDVIKIKEEAPPPATPQPPSLRTTINAMTAQAGGDHKDIITLQEANTPSKAKATQSDPLAMAGDHKDVITIKEGVEQPKATKPEPSKDRGHNDVISIKETDAQPKSSKPFPKKRAEQNDVISIEEASPSPKAAATKGNKTHSDEIIIKTSTKSSATPAKQNRLNESGGEAGASEGQPEPRRNDAKEETGGKETPQVPRRNDAKEGTGGKETSQVPRRNEAKEEARDKTQEQQQAPRRNEQKDKDRGTGPPRNEPKDEARGTGPTQVPPRNEPKDEARGTGTTQVPGRSEQKEEAKGNEQEEPASHPASPHVESLSKTDTKNVYVIKIPHKNTTPSPKSVATKSPKKNIYIIKVPHRDSNDGPEPEVVVQTVAPEKTGVMKGLEKLAKFFKKKDKTYLFS